MLFDEIYSDSFKPLRVCKSCGYEAWTEPELMFFTKDIRGILGCRNSCKECTKKRQREHRESDPEYLERQKACCRKGYADNKEIRSKNNREYHHKNKESRNANRRAYRLNNLEIEKAKAKTPEALAKARFYTAERRRIKKATKNLLTPADNLFIKNLYTQASLLQKITGIGWQIDHIFPLKSKFLCGFHHPLNLQIVDEETNQAKRNGLGYIGQYNLSPFYKNFINTSSRKDIFEALGSNMSWDDFISYEKLNFGGYL